MWPDLLGGISFTWPFYAGALIAYLVGAIPFGLLLTRFAGLGDIRNIGLAAAHLAAGDGGAVTNHHVVRATFRELEKGGLNRSRETFGPLVEYLSGVTT